MEVKRKIERTHENKKTEKSKRKNKCGTGRKEFKSDNVLTEAVSVLNRFKHLCQRGTRFMKSLSELSRRTKSHNMLANRNLAPTRKTAVKWSTNTIENEWIIVRYFTDKQSFTTPRKNRFKFGKSWKVFMTLREFWARFEKSVSNHFFLRSEVVERFLNVF